VPESEDPLDRPVAWRTALARAVAAATIVVLGVLGLVVLTSLLPTEVQRLVFHTPVTIVVLVGGTIWLLWRVSRRPPEG